MIGSFSYFSGQGTITLCAPDDSFRLVLDADHAEWLAKAILRSAAELEEAKVRWRKNREHAR